MKKRIVLALAILLFSGVANAQLKYGAKVGANLTDILSTSSLLDKASMSVHPQIGVFMQYKMGIFSIQPELLYTEKGGTFEGVFAKSNYLSLRAGLDRLNPDVSLVNQYLEVPVNLQLGLTIGKSRVFVQGAPYISFNLGGRINGDAKAYSNVDDLFPFSKVDMGLGAGAGVEFKKFQLSAKYDFGMLKLGQETINSISGVNYNPFYEMKSRNISVSLGYIF